MLYLLFYEKAPDYAQRQGPLQSDHLAHVLSAVRSGEVVLAGSLTNPTDGAALLLFQSGSPAAAEKFAAADPYVIHGVVSHWYVRAWETLVDKDAVHSLSRSK